MKQRIEKKLSDNLKPSSLEVVNNSNLHRGHIGDNGTNETHFAVIIKCEELKNLGRLQAHKKINQLLKDEFDLGLHALEIKIV